MIRIVIIDIINLDTTNNINENNIKVKLKGFKESYNLENSIDNPNHVTIEHHYDFVKRKMVKNQNSK